MVIMMASSDILARRNNITMDVWLRRTSCCRIGPSGGESENRDVVLVGVVAMGARRCDLALLMVFIVSLQVLAEPLVLAYFFYYPNSSYRGQSR